MLKKKTLSEGDVLDGIISMLRDGYPYAVIGTMMNVHQSRVRKIAVEAGLQSLSSRRQEFPKILKPKSLLPMVYPKKYMRKEVTKRVNPDFSLFVRENGRVHLPHEDQCKHILVVEGGDSKKDHYCQNRRLPHKSYCQSCMNELYVKNDKSGKGEP
ncbi:MAG: hypothetical protein AAF621_04470 [Pseudomonadota bacterium]